MDNGATWAIIVALATTLSGVVGWVARYLLRYIDKLEAALEKANTSTAATNEVNAKLAQLWIDEQRRKSAQDDP